MKLIIVSHSGPHSELFSAICFWTTIRLILYTAQYKNCARQVNRRPDLRSKSQKVKFQGRVATQCSSIANEWATIFRAGGTMDSSHK